MDYNVNKELLNLAVNGDEKAAAGAAQQRVAAA